MTRIYISNKDLVILMNLHFSFRKNFPGLTDIKDISDRAAEVYRANGNYLYLDNDDLCALAWALEHFARKEVRETERSRESKMLTRIINRYYKGNSARIYIGKRDLAILEQLDYCIEKMFHFSPPPSQDIKDVCIKATMVYNSGENYITLDERDIIALKKAKDMISSKLPKDISPEQRICLPGGREMDTLERIIDRCNKYIRKGETTC